jgi:peptidylprolyl isomerase
MRLPALLPLSLLLLAGCVITTQSPVPVSSASSAPAKTAAKVLEDSPASDWRQPDVHYTLYMDLPAGRIVIELAPRFAPATVENIRTLVREKYFDGLAVIRVQDNFVAQWGDPTEKKPIGSAKKTIPPSSRGQITADLPFTPLPDRDVYAAQTGYTGQFPAARIRRPPNLARALLREVGSAATTPRIRATARSSMP